MPSILHANEKSTSPIPCALASESLQSLQHPIAGRGAINFDYIGAAVTSIFQTMTQEGWADIMYALMDTISGWVWVYFIMLIIIGPWLALNLFLVVISTQYDENASRLKAQQDRELAELQEAQQIAYEAMANCTLCRGDGCSTCDPDNIGRAAFSESVSAANFGSEHDKMSFAGRIFVFK